MSAGWIMPDLPCELGKMMNDGFKWRSLTSMIMAEIGSHSSALTVGLRRQLSLSNTRSVTNQGFGCINHLNHDFTTSRYHELGLAVN